MSKHKKTTPWWVWAILAIFGVVILRFTVGEFIR